MNEIVVDPVFAAIHRYRITHDAYTAALSAVEPLQGCAERLAAEEAVNDRLLAPWLEALEELYRTVPTTLKGLRAYADVVAAEETASIADMGELPSLAVATLLRSIQALAPVPQEAEVRITPPR